MANSESQAVAICELCKVGLCKPHLVALYETRSASPRPSCRHDRRGQPARLPGMTSAG